MYEDGGLQLKLVFSFQNASFNRKNWGFYFIKLFVLFFVFFSGFMLPAWSREVTTQMARIAGNAYVATLNKSASGGKENVPYELKRVESLTIENDVVAYIIHLYPDGFLVMPARDEMAPVQFQCTGVSFTAVEKDDFIQYLIPRLKDVCSTIRERETGAGSKGPVGKTKSPFSPLLPNNRPDRNQLQLDRCFMEDNQHLWRHLLSKKEFKDTVIDQVKPLLSTTWNQGDPYNMMTPEISGEHTWTGCVATAMAQVMKYWEWPQTGNGSHSYFWYPEGAASQELSADFNHEFPWELMLDRYDNDGSATEDQKKAVASLMFDIGVSVEMNYQRDGSSASTWKMANAMVDYFGYDPAIKGITEWTTFGAAKNAWFWLVAKEIKMGCPVLFGVSGPDPANPGSILGHLVVADGYRVDSLGNQLHLNMGWGGHYNAYYTIDGIIAGYDFTYWGNQEAQLNLCPYQRAGAWLHINTTPYPILPDIFLDGNKIATGACFQVVEPGTHEVSFGHLDNYKTPDSISVAVADRQTVFVTGEYEPYRIKLYAFKGDHGQTSYSGEFEFGVDAEILVESDPDVGFKFSNWTGTVESEENPITLKLTGTTTLKANYTPTPTAEIKTDTIGEGYVRSTPDATTVNKGDTVNVQAKPDNGWVFDHWTGDLETNQADKVSLDLVMDRDRNITAHFLKLPMALPIMGNASLGMYSALCIQGSTAFCGINWNGVNIIDLSQNPNKIIGHYGIESGNISDIQTMNNLLLVSVGNGTANGVHVVDVTNPAVPTLLTVIDPSLSGQSNFSFFDLLVVGHVLYVAAARNGLCVVDLTSPSQPKILAHYKLPCARNLHLIGSTLYIQNVGSSLVALDVSDPSYPRYLGEIQVPDMYPQYATFVGDSAFVLGEASDNSSFIVEVGIQDPRNMYIQGDVDVPCSPLLEFSAGDYLLVRNYCGEILTYNLLPSGGVSLLERHSLTASDLQEGDDSVFCVTPDGLVKIHDFDQADMESELCVPLLPTIWSMAMCGNTAYVRTSGDGTQIYDIKDVSGPKCVGKLYDNGLTLCVSDDRLYGTDSQNFLIYSIADPQNPELIATAKNDWQDGDYIPYELKVEGGFAYVAGGPAGLFIFDVRNLEDVHFAGQLNNVGFASGLSIKGNNVALASSNVLCFVDTEDKENPRLTSMLSVDDTCTSIEWHNDVLYSTGGYRTNFSIYDVSNVENPQFVSSVQSSANGFAGSDIEVVDNELLVSNSGIWVYDIEHPLAPELIGVTHENSTSLAIKGNTIFSADFPGGHVYSYTLISDAQELIIPHVASSSVWTSQIVVDNYGSEMCQIAMNLDNQGKEIQGVPIEIQGGEVQCIDVKDSTCGSVTVPSSHMVVKQTFQNSTEGGIAEFVLSDDRSKTLDYLFPHYMADDLTWMGLAINDPGTQPAHVTATAYNQDGEVLNTTILTISSKSRFVGMISSLFPDLDFHDVAHVRLNSDRAISGLNISGKGNGQLLFMPAIGGRGPGDTLYMPHIASNWAAWNNYLVFDNTGDETEHADVTLYDGAGHSSVHTIDIASGSSVKLLINDIVEDTIMSGTVVCSSSNLLVRQSYQSKNQGGTAEFLLSGKASERLIFSFPTYAHALLDWMGLAICNVGGNVNDVILRAYRGPSLIEEKSIRLNPHERSTFVLSDFFDLAGEQGFDRIEAVGTGPLSGLNISGAGLTRLLFAPAYQLEE